MEAVTKFFNNYAKISLDGAPAEIAAYYDTSFVFAGPEGTEALKNDSVFLKWLDDVKDQNEKAGLISMEVKNVSTDFIGDRFIRAEVTWASVFSAKPESEITFVIHYILRKSADSFKIVCYISEEDQKQLMEEKGVGK